MDTGVGGRTRRVLVVLAITLGVLGMHGLAGGHHGPVPVLSSLTAATTIADNHPSGPTHAAEHAAHGVLAAGTAAVAPLHADGVGCDGDCEHPSGLLLLCVAVLLAAGLALAVGLARRTWRTVPATGPPSVRRHRTQASFRRLDLVADLCVSRT